MSLKISHLQSSDKSILGTWWALHKWPIIDPAMLPPTGLIVRNSSGLALVAGFLYLTDSSIAWLEYIISNPLCDKIERGQALDKLILALLAEAKAAGKSIVFTSSEHPKLIERHLTHGAIIGDRNTTQLIWRI